MDPSKKDTQTFLRHYTEHIEDILTRPSGTHAPDPGLLAQWISTQASERRRTAAKALADTIRYITHKELIQHCETLLDIMYNDPTKPIPAEHTLKWSVGEKTKSLYFMALICYDIAKRKGYRLPDQILIEFNYSDCPGSTVFLFDDMSYSGSQLSQLLKKIYVADVKKKAPSSTNKIILTQEIASTIQFEDIRVGVCFITQPAHDVLQQITFTMSNVFKIKGVFWETDTPMKNPYKLYATEIIPSLKDTLAPQLYADCVIYFSPYRNPTCICYFDHKVADSASTFLNVLRFGPVLPSRIDYKFIYNHQERKWSDIKPYYTQQEEILDKQIDSTVLIPFITGCPIPEDKKEALQTIPYHILMLTSGGPELDDDGAPTGKNVEYDFYRIDSSAPIFAFKNSVDLRCPLSWYKHNYFKGGRRATRRNIKRSKRATASVRNGRRSN